MCFSSFFMAIVLEWFKCKTCKTCKTGARYELTKSGFVENSSEYNSETIDKGTLIGAFIE